MRRTQKVVPLSVWLAKVERYNSTGEPGAIVRVLQEGEDGDEDITEDASLDEVRNKVPGLYLLIDSEGDTISRCRVTGSGERAMLPVRRGASGSVIERQAASAIREQGILWGDLATYQGAALKERDEAITKLRAERDELKELLLEEKLKNQTGESEHEEWIPLIQQGIDALTGSKMRDKFKEAAIGILTKALHAGIITDEQVQLLIPIANDEMAQLNSGIATSAIEKADAS